MPRREIVDIVNGDRKFPCHLQVNAIQKRYLKSYTQIDGDEMDEEMANEQAFELACEEASHCTGALIFMNNSCKLSRDRKIAELQKQAGSLIEKKWKIIMDDKLLVRR